MKRMVLGFAFDRVNQQVLLIRKNRPDWQAGKLNGVGGHIDPDDHMDSRAAMVREFKEETGLLVDGVHWEHRGVIQAFSRKIDEEGWHVSVWCVEMGTWPDAVRTMTDEVLQWVNIDNLDALAASGDCLDNIPTLVQLCQMRESKPSNRTPRFTLEY